jgi:hypothetical protein
MAAASTPMVPGAEGTAFPAAASILTGFDLASTPEAWNIGDRVLLLLRMEKSGVATDRFLLVELTDRLDVFHTVEMSAKSSRGPIRLSSSTAGTKITLFDASGATIDQAEGRFPSDLLGYGLTDGAMPYVGRPLNDPTVVDSLTEEQFERMMRGWMTLFSFSGSLNKKGMFNQMLKDVVARPSLLGMLLNPTASMGMGDPGPTVGPVWSADGRAQLETVDVPLELTISGKKSMIGRVTAATPVAPLSLCGGVLSVQAFNADTPTTRLEIRLLATERGKGGQGFRPAEDTIPK